MAEDMGGEEEVSNDDEVTLSKKSMEIIADYLTWATEYMRAARLGDGERMEALGKAYDEKLAKLKKSIEESGLDK